MEPFKFLEPEYRHAANNFSKLFIEIFRGSDNEEYKDFKCENLTLESKTGLSVI